MTEAHAFDPDHTPGHGENHQTNDHVPASPHVPTQEAYTNPETGVVEYREKVQPGDLTLAKTQSGFNPMFPKES